MWHSGGYNIKKETAPRSAPTLTEGLTANLDLGKETAMSDQIAHARVSASSERVAELHQLAREDYAKGQQQRASIPNLSPSYAAASLAADVHAPEPTDLDVAISVAQQLLDSDQALSLREALRLLLRALGAEPVDPSFAAEFPTIAAHLAAERGDQS